MTPERLNEIMSRFSRTRIAVAGDFFLDRYWEIDATLDEPSIETGLTAYQVTSVRTSPGAAGTVVNNLAALGIGKIFTVGFVGNDSEGFALKRDLANLGVDQTHLRETAEQSTPCYTKPLRNQIELNRFDIKNRKPTSFEVEQKIIDSLQTLVTQVDAVIVMDQVSEENCGVVTTRVRDFLALLGRRHPERIIYADSRERISLFREMIIKCNEYEALQILKEQPSQASPSLEKLSECGVMLSRNTGRPVFITMGERGQLVVDATTDQPGIEHVPAVRVDREIDICGAGDATSAALVSSLCTGATPAEAAAIGNLTASVTIRKIGQTGTATPKEIADAL